MSEIITDDAVREKLKAPFPAEAISQHPTKTFLSTIKAIYIVERLNDVVGIGGWDLEHEIVSDPEDYVSVRGRLHYGKRNADDGPAYSIYEFRTPDQYGGHKKTGTNTEPADGYKSAVTDCQSKCASYLEIGIDVFKGKATNGSKAPRKAKKEVEGDEKEISVKQWEFLKKLGGNVAMTEKELIVFVKWVADENNISPRHWKIGKLMLPDENFNTQFAKFSQANIDAVVGEELE